MYDFKLEQFDVKKAFLYGELEEKFYMKQFHGFEVERKEHHVCLLKRSLYGLKQFQKEWYKRFDTFILGHGYSSDSCVYFWKLDDESFIYLLLYVDDMLIVAKSLSEIYTLKLELSMNLKWNIWEQLRNSWYGDQERLRSSKVILDWRKLPWRSFGEVWYERC